MLPVRHQANWLQINRPKQEIESKKMTAVIPAWTGFQYFCPFGCLSSDAIIKVAEHLSTKHKEMELQSWGLNLESLGKLLIMEEKRTLANPTDAAVLNRIGLTTHEAGQTEGINATYSIGLMKDCLSKLSDLRKSQALINK